MRGGRGLFIKHENTAAIFARDLRIRTHIKISLWMPQGASAPITRCAARGNNNCFAIRVSHLFSVFLSHEACVPVLGLNKRARARRQRANQRAHANKELESTLTAPSCALT